MGGGGGWEGHLEVRSRWLEVVGVVEVVGLLNQHVIMGGGAG